MSGPEDHHNGRREIQLSTSDAADEALEQLMPYIKQDKAREAGLILARMVSKSHSGPIPSADELEHLERVLAGSANRCFEMAEREQAHRHDVEKTIVRREFSLRGRGQWLAILALLMLLVVVCYLAYLGEAQAAAWLGAVTIIGVVAIFVTGKAYDAKETSAAEQRSEPAPPPQQLPRNERRNQQRGRK